MPIWLGIVIGVVCFLAGAALMFLVPFVRNNIVKNNAKKIIRDAEIKAEHITKNAQLDGKQAVNELKQEANREIHERKQELQQQERSLQQREQNIERRDAGLIAKENALDEKNETLSRRLKEVDRKEATLQEKIDSIIVELEKVAQMSTQEARDELFNRVESKVSKEIAAFIK